MKTSITNTNGCIIINGKKYEVPNGSNVSIVNNSVFVDGKSIDADTEDDVNGGIKIVVEGAINQFECSQSCKLEVTSGTVENVEVHGSLDITGDIEGNVSSGGSCNIVGDIEGSVKAGGSVNVVGDVGGL